MNSKQIRTTLGGLLLGVVVIHANVLVDDFTNTTGANKLGGNWSADSDIWPGVGGSSKVLDIFTGSDLVLGEGCASGCYAGHNIAKAYDGGALVSKLKVTADAGVDKKWAYAGWVMNFKAEVGPDAWEKLPWEKGNEVNISSCTELELDIGFTANRQLWIGLYNPWIEKDSPTSPQYGWRYQGTGAVEVGKKFALTSGFVGIAPKWIDPAAAALDLTKVTRLIIFYEGQTGLVAAEPAPYDQNEHTLTVKKVALNGVNCQVVPNATPNSIFEIAAGKHKRFSMNIADGALHFTDIAKIGTMEVAVRSLSGKVMTSGVVSTLRPIMDLSMLDNGVYMVHAKVGNENISNTITLLK